MLKTKEEIQDWLDDMGIKKYIINDDLTVDVNNSVYLTNAFVPKFPVQFGIIKGDFYCNSNRLISLKGAPYEVKGTFNCGDNQLTNLDYCPKIIGNILNIYLNPIATLKGFDSQIGGEFLHSCPEQNPVKILELKDYYKTYKNIGIMKVSLSGKELKSILEYLDLKEEIAEKKEGDSKRLKL